MADINPEGKLLEIIKKARQKERLKRDKNIFTRVNIILIVLIIIVAGVFIYDLLTFNYKGLDLKIDIPETSQEEIQEPSLRNNSFEAYETNPPDVHIEEKKPLGTELAKDLNLLGIVKGNDDQAIIEDKQSNKTFFLYRGDSIRDFKVLDIKEKKVILDYKGEKIELEM